MTWTLQNGENLIISVSLENPQPKTVHHTQKFLHISCLWVIVENELFLSFSSCYIIFFYDSANLQGICTGPYLIEHMPRLPYVTFLALGVIAYGHSFEACLFDVLSRCTGVKELDLDFVPEIQLEVILSFIWLSNTWVTREVVWRNMRVCISRDMKKEYAFIGIHRVELLYWSDSDISSCPS